MSQNNTMYAFEDAKNKISVSSRKIYRYLILTTIIGLILAVVLLVLVLVFLSSLGLTIADIDLDNIYETGALLISEEILATALAAVIILGISLLALVVISILTYVQYYRLGTGFSKLHSSDPRSETNRYISFGIYGYVIAVVAGIFIPGIFGTVVSLLANVSLAFGVFLIYQLFQGYTEQGRFKGKHSIILFIGIALNVVASITTLFNDFGTIGSLVGFILMLIGFKNLSRDIMLVEPPTGEAIPAKDI
ncbi:MAG: hypothetical protein ACTSQC_11800 [Candidatus Heimdallarchaeaceae archaeon]